MNRYDHGFRTLPPRIRANGLQRAKFAHRGLMEHRWNGFGPEDDDAIVRQFDILGMNEYWEIQLSEPLACDPFARMLSIHFMTIENKPNWTDEEKKASGPRAMHVVDFFTVHILSALRAARAHGESWFLTIPEPLLSTKLDAQAWFGFVPSDVVIVQPDPPSDGIDLSKLRVRPRAAAEWLLAMPKRRHLVPPSLATFLASVSIYPTTGTKAPEQVPAQPSRGRKEGTGYQVKDEPIARRMIEFFSIGKAKSLTEAAWLVVGRDGAGASGNGKPESKVERLVKAANKIMLAEKNRE